jgi:hypothetical protein
MSGDGCGGGHCGGHGVDGAGGGLVNALPVEPAVPRIARLEINGAPVLEQSHEYVIRKSGPDAEDR